MKKCKYCKNNMSMASIHYIAPDVKEYKCYNKDCPFLAKYKKQFYLTEYFGVKKINLLSRYFQTGSTGVTMFNNICLTSGR